MSRLAKIKYVSDFTNDWFLVDSLKQYASVRSYPTVRKDLDHTSVLARQAKHAPYVKDLICLD